MAWTVPENPTAHASATVMSPWPHPISRTVLPSRLSLAASRLPNQACKRLIRCCICVVAMRSCSSRGWIDGSVHWISSTARLSIRVVVSRFVFDMIGKGNCERGSYAKLYACSNSEYHDKNVVPRLEQKSHIILEARVTTLALTQCAYRRDSPAISSAMQLWQHRIASQQNRITTHQALFAAHPTLATRLANKNNPPTSRHAPANTCAYK